MESIKSKYSDLVSCLIYISPSITYTITFLPSCLANSFAIHFEVVISMSALCSSSVLSQNTLSYSLISSQIKTDERHLLFQHCFPDKSWFMWELLMNVCCVLSWHCPLCLWASRNRDFVQPHFTLQIHFRQKKNLIIALYLSLLNSQRNHASQVLMKFACTAVTKSLQAKICDLGDAHQSVILAKECIKSERGDESWQKV